MWPLKTELCCSASQNNFKVKFPLSFRLIYLHSCWKTWTEQRVPSGCVLLSASWPRLGSWSTAKKERTAVCQPWGLTVGLASAAGGEGPQRDNVFGARGLKHLGKPIVKDKQREARFSTVTLRSSSPPLFHAAAALVNRYFDSTRKVTSDARVRGLKVCFTVQTCDPQVPRAAIDIWENSRGGGAYNTYWNDGQFK